MVHYARSGGPFIAVGTTGGAVADIPNHGITVLDATVSETYTLAPPSSGVKKTIVCQQPSSAIGYVVYGSSAADSSVPTVTFTGGAAGVAATKLVFTTSSTFDSVVELIGINSTRWAVLGAVLNSSACVPTTQSS